MARYSSPIPGALITINKVYLARDLFVAKIFFSVFGATIEEPAAMAVMNNLKGEFRHEISQKLNLRHTPRIEFCFDKNTEYAAKIQVLLKDQEE